MPNALINVSFWFLVIVCFLIQGRVLNLPLALVPAFAFTASWIFIISERRRVLKNELLLIQSELRRRRGS